ncbi:MAG: hypothetical protein WCO77_12430, partial [bacterium]
MKPGSRSQRSWAGTALTLIQAQIHISGGKRAALRYAAGRVRSLSFRQLLRLFSVYKQTPEARFYGKEDDASDPVPYSVHQ